MGSTGQLFKEVKSYSFVYDLSKIEVKFEEFANPIRGVVTVCGNVVPRKSIRYEYDNIEKILKIVMDSTKWGFRLKKNTSFSMQLRMYVKRLRPDNDAIQFSLTNNTNFYMYYLSQPSRNITISDPTFYAQNQILYPGQTINVGYNIDPKQTTFGYSIWSLYFGYKPEESPDQASTLGSVGVYGGNVQFQAQYQNGQLTTFPAFAKNRQKFAKILELSFKSQEST